MKYVYKSTKRSDIKSYSRDGKTFYAAFFRVKGYDGTTKQVHKHGLGSIKEAANYIANAKARFDGNATVLFGTVANEYMDSLMKHNEFSPNTIAMKRSCLKHMLRAFGNMPICNITPLMVRDWQEELSRTVKPQSVNAYKICMSCIMKYAMLYYGLSSNPARLALNLHVRDSDRKQRNVWKDEDIRKALEHENNASMRVLWLLLYYSGLRISEALALTTSDVLKDGVTVLRQKTARNLIIPPKSGSSGKVLLHPDMASMLLEYVRRTGIENGPIFPYSYQMVYSHLLRLCEKAGVPRITPHDLRHSSITNDANRGTPLAALQAKARHKRASTTEQYYIHLDEETQKMLNFDYKIVTFDSKEAVAPKENNS